MLDVVLDADQASNRLDDGPRNLALLRRLALNLAKLEPSKGSIRAKLKRAGWDNNFLASLLTPFAGSSPNALALSDSARWLDIAVCSWLEQG